MTQMLRAASLGFFTGIILLLSGCGGSSSNNPITLEDPNTGMVYKQGVHFSNVSTPAENADDLTIFFSFSCPHCRTFHTPLNNWLETQTVQPSVQWVPVNLQKIYAAGVLLEKPDEIRASLFECIWEQDNCLFSSESTDEDIAQWLSEHANVGYPTALEVFQSAETTQLASGKLALKQLLKPQFVPQIVVSGRYLVDQSAFNNWDDYFNLIVLLINQHQEPLPQ